MPDSMTGASVTRIRLLVECRRDSVIREEIEARLAGDGSFELLHSPAYVFGVAKGDRVRVEPTGAFVVVHRSGNVALQIFHWTDTERVLHHLMHLLPAIDGCLDGDGDSAIVVTVPRSTVFCDIVRTMHELGRRIPELEWYIGNPPVTADARPAATSGSP